MEINCHRCAPCSACYAHHCRHSKTDESVARFNPKAARGNNLRSQLLLERMHIFFLTRKVDPFTLVFPAPSAKQSGQEAGREFDLAKDLNRCTQHGEAECDDD